MARIKVTPTNYKIGEKVSFEGFDCPDFTSTIESVTVKEIHTEATPIEKLVDDACFTAHLKDVLDTHGRHIPSMDDPIAMTRETIEILRDHLDWDLASDDFQDWYLQLIANVAMRGGYEDDKD